jgi:hypothetical protein
MISQFFEKEKSGRKELKGSFSRGKNCSVMIFSINCHKEVQIAAATITAT